MLTPDKVLRERLSVIAGDYDSTLFADCGCDREFGVEGVIEELLACREALRKLASKDRWVVNIGGGRHGTWAKENWSGELQPGEMGLIADAWAIARACLPEFQDDA